MTSEFIEERESLEKKTVLAEAVESLLINLPLLICCFAIVIALLHDVII